MGSARHDVSHHTVAKAVARRPDGDDLRNRVNASAVNVTHGLLPSDRADGAQVRPERSAGVRNERRVTAGTSTFYRLTTTAEVSEGKLVCRRHAEDADSVGRMRIESPRVTAYRPSSRGDDHDPRLMGVVWTSVAPSLRD